MGRATLVNGPELDEAWQEPACQLRRFEGGNPLCWALLLVVIAGVKSVNGATCSAA